MSLIYAGIGSRKTPQSVLDTMFDLGMQLDRTGWTLRSGFAEGADMAFCRGADFVHGEMEIFIPWVGFNGSSKTNDRFIIPTLSPKLVALTRQYHPAWHRCTSGAKRLHARNCCQVLGLDLKTPADLVICWTPGGSGSGGTGQALRIARAYNIPIFDLAIEGRAIELGQFIHQKEIEHG
jgi:hypothetical protein